MPRALTIALRALEALAWAGFFAFAALFLALRYWVLPDIERHRDPIVAVLERAIELPVRVGPMQAGWDGLRPQLTLNDVRVFDRDGREALRLPSVRVVAAWRSLLALELRLHSLAIDGPKLTVRRDPRGAVYVAGMKLARGSGESRGTDWILAQGEILISNAEIEWRDELRRAPPLALSALNLQLRNSGERHAAGLQARPPAQLGSQLEVRAELTGASAADPAAWSGRLYAEVGHTDLAAWHPWVDYPLDVGQGQGALRMWVSAERGAITRATADLKLADVSVRLAKGLAPLELESVSGRLQARVVAHGYQLAGSGLELDAKGIPPMRPVSFQVEWQAAAGGRPEHGMASASLVELEPLSFLAEYLPLPGELRKLLAELAPRGNLHDARLDWTGPFPGPDKFTARSRFSALAMNPWRTVPGFSGLSGSVEASEAKGSLNLASTNAEFDLPAVFPDPRLHFDTLNGQIGWELRGGRAAEVRLRRLAFANQHLAGTASGSYATAEAGPGVADLQAQLQRVDGAFISRYLPLGRIMGEGTRAWLVDSILGGDGSDVRFRLKGDLRDFPFTDKSKGEFMVAARVAKGGLDYASGWPRISDVEAELLFERDSMEITARAGAVLGTRLGGVRVRIPSLSAKAPELHVDGQAEGPTQQFLDYIEKSPVRRMIGGFTDTMSARGDGKLTLKLRIPLNDPEKTGVTGEYQFAGNAVYFDPLLPPVARADGRLAFTEKSLAVQGARGSIFGGAVTVSGGTLEDGSLQIVARGQARLAAMGDLLEEPWRSRLNGAFAYTATIRSSETRTQVTLESSLRGVASKLPAPLEKAAGDTLPLRVDFYPAEGGLRDRVTLQLGRLLAAEVTRRRQGAAMEVQRATLALEPPPGQPLRLPERRGYLVYGSLPAFDFDRWRALGDAAEGAGAVQFDVKFGVLDAAGLRLRNAALRGGVDDKGWSAQIASDLVTGEVVYRSAGAGELTARLAELHVPEELAARREAAGLDTMASGEALKRLPAIDALAERMTLRGKDLGRVEVVVRPAGGSLRIDKLSVVNPDGAFNGKGQWVPKEGGAAPAGASRTTLEFELDASNVGRLLDRLGYPEQVKGGKARLYGGLGWSGDPSALDYRSLNGDLSLQADDGQFLAIDPAAGRLVSLMSLQMLPRRVTLDFRDVFSKGFQFDHLQSSLRFSDGVVRTNDFRMRGSAAEVEMSGEADLARETQNLRVRVLPNIGDSAAGAVAIINPAVGIATLLAQRALKNPIGQMFAFEYVVTGPWTDPKVEKVAVSLPQPAESPERGGENP